jgi:hypothetical protein
MCDHPLEPVFVVVLIEFLLVFVEGLVHIGRHIEHLLEGTVGVEFKLLHCIEVKLEALECEEKHIRQRFDAGALVGLDFLVALRAEVCVLALHYLHLDVLREGFLQGGLVHDPQPDRHLLLWFLAHVLALLPYCQGVRLHLEHPRDDILAPDLFEV